MSAFFRALAVAALASLPFALGCTTESFCFANCDSSSGNGAGGSAGGAGYDSGPLFNTGGSITGSDGAAGKPGACQGDEICNGIDDNCNGQIDEGIDFKDPSQCGTCANNCRTRLQNVIQSSITCTPPPDPELGKTPGTCSSTQCAQDFWDVDGNPANGCEYYCANNPKGTVTVDRDNGGKCGIDDDCDGKIDEDLDVCSDPLNCGECGRSCVVTNGTGKCVSTATGSACNKSNTNCELGKCDTGWWSVPGGQGCWYHCVPSNGGVEICDDKDNDCDNLVDDEDPDLATGDPDVGKDCQGGNQGECVAPAHTGVKKCILGAISCCDPTSNDVTATHPNLPKTGLLNGECKGTTPVVLHPGDQLELCNGLDDDCNGLVDDAVSGVGQTCGTSIGICSSGILQCAAGKPSCVGSTPPATDPVTGAPIDPCNGVDDDCDGVIDGSIPTGAVVKCTSDAGCPSGTVCLAHTSAKDKVCAVPPRSVGDACNAPPPAPCMNASGQEVACGTAGATPVPQPCTAGKLVCSLQLVCSGAAGKTSSVDRCGEDSNCDGHLDNQPNLQTDPANCGACGNDCNALGAHASWTCVKGACTLSANKCRPGFIDCDANANDCERACTPSGAEQCNGFDDNCNCQIDEAAGMAIPTPAQVCGVNASASDPSCAAGNGTTGIKVACSAGKWGCTFPAGYCNQGTPASCSTTQDLCDGKDNNCNGNTDENNKLPVQTTGYVGQPCASDDGKPPPGDGACRTTGTFQCKTTTTTACTAVRNDAAAGAELCDGIDNDCDGSVDEAFNAKGTNATYFVKPGVVLVAASTYMFQYEASRPAATTTAPGTGNGYWCTGAGCTGGVPPAPAGTTIDRTPACSVPNKIPWFNVTPAEVEETCQAMGGTVCSTPVWTSACQDGASCKWGYGTGCTVGASYTSGPFCNLGAFDFDGVAGAPNTDGLLVTKSSRLNQCWAAYGATPASTGLFDLTGNLREITKRAAEDYPLMGGAFDTDVEAGAQCNFTFYSVPSTFKLYDAGFRCCFATDPTK